MRRLSDWEHNKLVAMQINEVAVLSPMQGACNAVTVAVSEARTSAVLSAL